MPQRAKLKCRRVCPLNDYIKIINKFQYINKGEIECINFACYFYEVLLSVKPPLLACGKCNVVKL